MNRRRNDGRRGKHREVADAIPGATSELLTRIARRHHLHIVGGSFLETAPGYERLFTSEPTARVRHADARALVSETLGSRGANVIVVESADEAIAALQTIRPDVVITDIGMAYTDGFELLKRIRQSNDQTIREVPAAALTAYARAEDRMKVLQGGFQMHLVKPVDPAELIVAVAVLAKRMLHGPQ